MDLDQTTLADLVGDVDIFAAEHWGRRPLMRHSTTDVGRLLSIDDIERLLLSSARRPSFRLVQDGVTLPPERSTTATHFGGRRVDDVADPAKIVAAIDAGATLVLQGLQRISLTLAAYCRRLERATSHPVQANAYLTPAGASGLARHRDDHDVLILQLHGHKSWDVDELGIVTTSTGDVLYLPAATPHSAAAQDEPSLHLTLGILRITHAQVLRRALDEVGPELGQPLPLGYARPDRTELLTAELHNSFTALGRRLAEFDVGDLAAAEQSRARSRRRPLSEGHLRSVLISPHVAADTVVSRRLDLDAGLDGPSADDGRILLQLPDRRLRLPAAMRPAVERLLADGEVAVRSLPGLDPASRVVLVRRLIREGVLVVTST